MRQPRHWIRTLGHRFAQVLSSGAAFAGRWGVHPVGWPPVGLKPPVLVLIRGRTVRRRRCGGVVRVSRAHGYRCCFGAALNDRQ